MTCYHIRKVYVDCWRCKKCGVVLDLPAKEGIPTFAVGENVEELDRKFQLHDPRWGQTPGADIEKKYKRTVDQMRHDARRNKSKGPRITHKIPPEVYHAFMRKNGRDYWKDKSNLVKHKIWKVQD